MAPGVSRSLHYAIFAFAILAASSGCSGGNSSGVSAALGGGSPIGGSSSGALGGATAYGGSSNGNSNGGSNHVAATSSGGAIGLGGLPGVGGSHPGGQPNATGGTSAATVGGRDTGGGASGGTNSTGGALISTTGGAKTAGGGSDTGGLTGKGGSSSSSVGGASKGGAGSTTTGGTDQGGSSTSVVGSGGGSTSPGTTSASSANSTIVPDPSFACGMSGGIPAPTLGTLVFRATLQLGTTHDVGVTQYGHRRVIDVKGGTLTGDRIQATFLTGGLDLELALSNGIVELEEIDVLRTSDGTLIYLRGCGMAPAGDSTVRVVPDFEVANSSSFAWLNTGKFAGTRVLDATAGTIELDVYDISSVTVADPRIQLANPSGVPTQPWDCATLTGSKGSSVFTENVTLGSSLSIGASKRGTRNIIPITGGTVSGQLTGTVLSGGGDYQLVGSTTKLDARYSLASNDGEFVVVRNCGPLGSLVPQFETRADGPYAFLNSNTYLSSDPGSGSGGVSITFYKVK